LIAILNFAKVILITLHPGSPSLWRILVGSPHGQLALVILPQNSELSNNG
jgi:hypothetical protein